MTLTRQLAAALIATVAAKANVRRSHTLSERSASGRSHNHGDKRTDETVIA
jgi:hypothetical protein